MVTDREPLTARDGAAALVLAVALVLAGWVRLVPGVVGAFHDDAVYAMTAKALAEGDGYRLINFPGAPPQTKYPILYPALLALLWHSAATLEARLAVMQVATLLAAALAIAGAYLYVVRFRYVARAPAFAAGVLCASAPNLLYYATQTLSEMPFMLALVASLWATDAYVRAERSDACRGLLTGVAAGLPFLCRSAGAVIPLVAVVVSVRARRPVRWMLVGSALVVVPWLVWTARGVGNPVAEPIVGYQGDYLRLLSRGYFGATSGSPFGLALAIFGANVVKACVAIGDIAFEGIAPALYASSDWAATLLGLVGAATWLAVVAHAPLATLPATLLVYLAFVCAWPWPPDRFMIPVLFFLLAMLLGLVSRAARVGALAVSLVAIVAAIPNARTLADYAAANTRSHYPYFMLPDAPVAWSSYGDAFTWLRAHAAPDDVFAAGFDSMTALYTAHPTVRPFVPRPSALYYAAITGDSAPALGSPSDFVGALATYRVRYLFVSPMPAFPEEDAFYELVSRARAEHPDLLRPVYRGSDPRFVVFEVGPADAAADRPR
jgi:hypothetical protein